MGAPVKLASNAQVPSGLAHFTTTLNVLKVFRCVLQMVNFRLIKQTLRIFYSSLLSMAKHTCGIDNQEYKFTQDLGKNRLVKEPIGVCGMITPWNWPLNQIGCKVAPALATGCTMVLKPSEMTPLSAVIFAEIMDKAGVPKVFSLCICIFWCLNCERCSLGCISNMYN